MKRDDVRRDLEETGRSIPPPPDPAFARALEERLRAVHATLPGEHGAGTTPHPHTVPVRAWWHSPVPVAAAVALVMVVALGAVLRPPAGVELATAFDATVTLPGGRSVPARAGQRLADGAVVVTGPRGHVQVDGVRLGPDEIAVVRDDRLHPVREAPREARRPSAAPSPRPRSQPTPEPGPGGELPSLPALTPTPSEGARGEPAQRPTEPTAPPPSRPAGSEAGEPDDVVADGRGEPDAGHAIGLAVRGEPGKALLAWTEFHHPDFAFFVVLRAPHPSAPEWPPAGESELIGRSADPRRRQFADSPPYRPAYRVVAVDRQGRELARSPAVAPGDARR